MGRPKRDGLFKIAAHPHRQIPHPVARRDLGQQREMQRGFFIDRRDAHQPAHGQIKRQTFLDKIVGIRWKNTGLLIFFAGVNLHEHIRTAPHFLRQPRKGLRQFGAVKRVNDVK